MSRQGRDEKYDAQRLPLERTAQREGLAPRKHPSMPLLRVVRHAASMLPSVWMPQVEPLAAQAGGAAERDGVRLAVFLPDPACDRAFVGMLYERLGDAVRAGVRQVRAGDDVHVVRPMMAYCAEVPLRHAGALRGELHRHGLAPDVFDIRLHAARARGMGPLSPLLDVDAWMLAREDAAASLVMRLHRWAPAGSGPRAA